MITIENIYDFVEHHTDINKIYLDIDGVVLHSCEAMCKVIYKKYGIKLNGSDILTWNFKETDLGLTDQEIDELFDDERFFSYVTFINGAKEFINTYKDRIVMVTHSNPKNYIQKRVLFDINGLDVPIIPVPLSLTKDVINMENGLFIDDSTRNLNVSNAKYKIQFREYWDDKNETREWIKGWDGNVVFDWGKYKAGKFDWGLL